MDEGQLIVENINACGNPTPEMLEQGGLYISRRKYRVAKYLAEIDACYLTGESQSGGCLQRTTQTIVFGAYAKSEGQNAGDCNMAVERLAKMLIKQGY